MALESYTTDIALQKGQCSEVAIHTMSTTSPQHSDKCVGINSDSDMDEEVELFSFSQLQAPEDGEYVDSDAVSPRSNLLKHFINNNPCIYTNNSSIYTNIPTFDMSQESGVSVATPVPVRRPHTHEHMGFEYTFLPHSAKRGSVESNSHTPNTHTHTHIRTHSPDTHTHTCEFDAEFHMCSQSSDTTVCDPYQAPNPWKRARKQHMRQQRQIEAVRQILTSEGPLQVIQEIPDDWEEGQIISP